MLHGDYSNVVAFLRMVPWGRPMCDNGLSYLKAIGIRVHTVRYQKIRKHINKKDDSDDDGDNAGHLTSKEYKRIRGALTGFSF